LKRKQNKFTVIFSENEEDFLKFKASAGDPEIGWISPRLKSTIALSLVKQDYELERDVFVCINPKEQFLALNYKNLYQIPDWYSLLFTIYPSVPDEYVLDIAEKNDYLNPKNNIQMQMVK
jgi:hypothetical protein